jgi:hypothetical protein
MTKNATSAAKPDGVLPALVLFALLAAAALWGGPGIVNTRAGGDSPFLLIRTHQLVENLRAGIFPARWMPDAAYGLGYPFFNFYAALPYYFAALLNVIGVDLLASIKIVQTLGFVFAALAMYGWARSKLPSSRAAAFVAAMAYLFAPFHLVNVYVRGDSLSEFYAFVFYPLILWAVDGVIDRPRARSIARLALVYAALVTTHNVSALIFSPFVLLYILLQIVDVRTPSRQSQVSNLQSRISRVHSLLPFVHCASGIVLGLLLSAWVWLPALGEAPLVQLDAQTTGYFNYAEHFRSVDLIQSSPAFDYNTEPTHTPFAMGLTQAVLAAAGVMALLNSRRGSIGFRLFILLGLSASTVMITPLSKFLWDALPLLPLAQFPWRFLSVQALFTSLAIGYLVFTPRPVAVRRWLALAIGFLLAASGLALLRPEHLAIRSDEVTPQRIQLYEAFTTNIGATIRAEYLPRTMIPRPYTSAALIDPSSAPQVIATRGEAHAEQIERGPISQRWLIDATSDATLIAPLTFFPGWQAAIDGQPVMARAADDLGWLEVDTPRGVHTLELRLAPSPLRGFAEGLSLASVLGVVALFAARRRRMKDKQPAWDTFILRLRSFFFTQRYIIVLGLFAIIAAAIASSFNAVDAREDDLVMDFETRPWLHHARDDFAGWAHLARYELDEELLVGETFNVSIEWRDVLVGGAIVELQLVAPSTHVFGAPPPLAMVSAPLREAVNEYALEIPESLARGIYYVRVEVSDTNGNSRHAYLRPVVNDAPAHTQASIDPAWARVAGQIELHSVSLMHTRPDLLTVALDWSALQPIAANYALSLRLNDENGRNWITLDTQPGYGFLPTSAWRRGEVQHDAYTLSLPEEMPRDQGYVLDVVWYRVASLREIGRVRAPGISLATLYESIDAPAPLRIFDLPSPQQSVEVTFGDVIRLLGYDWAQRDEQLALTVYWQALSDMDADYKFFVHVFDPGSETIIAQVDAMPRGNTYPTSNWLAGEVVSETFELPLNGSGTYRVALGWVDPATTERVPADDAQGRSIDADRYILPEQVSLP